jgi:hypothetical protein
MRLGWAVPILAMSCVLIAAAVSIRSRSRRRAGDVLLAVGGAGLGVGALFLQEDVSTAAWVLTPALVAVLCVVHARMLLASGGPLRQ